MRLGYRAIILGFILTVVFAVVAIYLEMIVMNNFTVTDTLIPVLTYFFLIVALLIINPILNLLYNYVTKTRLFRPFNRHEIILVMMMTLVTSGVSGLGLSYYLIPMIGTVNSPSRSTYQTDWGLLTQTVLKNKNEAIKTKIYGDVESEDANSITLRHYDGKSKGQDEIKTYQKSEYEVQRPLINPKLVLGRDDAKIFENGLPEREEIDPKTGKTVYFAQNSFPAFAPFPSENFEKYQERIKGYLSAGQIQKGYTFWGNVPWSKIFPPFCYWLIFVIILYLILFSLAKILFTQWAKYERLQFPLATIPQMLLGDSKEGDENSKIYPTYTIWKNLFFIIGFVLALSLILLTGFSSKFSLYLNVQDYVGNTIFEALKDMRIEMHIFFLIIGIAYIVPKEISFSVWFFGVIFILQILFAVWFGFGKTAGSFGQDFYTKENFFTAQAFGGLVIFSSLALWNVRHYIFSGIYKLSGWRPKGVKDEVVNETAIASIIFILSCISILFVMLWMNITLTLAIIYAFITLLFIVAAMRVASECGIIGFQNITAGGTHFVSNMVGIKNVGANSFVNVLVMQVIFFFDTKTFLAPNVMVAQKVEDENQISKSKYWIVLFLAVILGVIASFIYLTMLVYHKGSKGLESWYYVSVPNEVYSRSIGLLKSTATDDIVNIQPTISGFFILGMVFMATLLLARTKWFWVPHPVGILLWVSPDETKYFLFSFFLGWLIKFIAVKFGTKETIENMKKWAIGLIFGHITAVIILGILKMFITLTVKATLNFH